MKFNITKNLNAYGGRNKWSVPIGTTRNIKGSSNRIYNYCSRTTNTPFYCMFQLQRPIPPIPPSFIIGSLTFSFIYTGPGTITENLLKEFFPIQSIPGIFEFRPTTTIIGNNVYAVAETILYELPSYPPNLGFTFALPPPIPSIRTIRSIPSPVDFFNDYTENLTFISANNLPFDVIGSQFANLSNEFNISSDFKPYFLPGTSLEYCFQNCPNFNSNISNWDTSNVTNMSFMFQNATLFNNGNITRTRSMLRAISIQNWDTSNVTDMSFMFQNAETFNQDISSWNVSKVTTMESMFENAIAFKQDISNWSPYACTNMENMFLDVDMNDPDSETNQDNYNALLSSWGITKLSNMQPNVPFSGGNSQYSSADAVLGRANLTGLTGSGGKEWQISDGGLKCSLQFSFEYTNPVSLLVETFITDYLPVITLPDVFTITTYLRIGGTTGATGDNINTTDNVEVNISSVFNESSSYSSDFGFTFNNITIKSFYNENTSNLAFISSTNFPFDILGSQFEGLTGGFNISSNFIPYFLPDTYLEGCFRDCINFNSDVGSWDTSNVINMKYMFSYAREFNKDISLWNTSNVTDMQYMFQQATAFNKPINTTIIGGTAYWDTSRVKYMDGMFDHAQAFNNGSTALNWNTSIVESMENMFYNAGAFNQPINTTTIGGTAYWDTKNVTNMSSMFAGATAFNQDISLWNTSSVTTMPAMFQDATAFNQNISNWNTSNVTTMVAMFNGATEFNQQINTTTIGDTAYWDVSLVTDMSFMFQNARAFNQPIGLWNTSQVTNMAFMFNGATAFNQPINTTTIGGTAYWDVSNVTDMQRMFQNARAFNQPIGNWDVSNVTNTQSMFSGATAFKQDISNWSPYDCINMENMFLDVDMNELSNQNNYNNLLTSWGITKLSNMESNVLFSGGNSQYSSSQAILGRENLTKATGSGGKNWSITDGGLKCSLNFSFQYTSPDSLTVGTFITNYLPVKQLNNVFTITTYLEFGGATGTANQNIPTNQDINVYISSTFRESSSYSSDFGFTFSIPPYDPGVPNRDDLNRFYNDKTSNLNFKSSNFPFSKDGYQFVALSKAFIISPNFQPYFLPNTSLLGCFYNCSLSNYQPNSNISSWDTTNVTNMSYMFNGATAFNQPINTMVVPTGVTAWITTNVTNMTFMFNDAKAFDNPIGNWDVSNVINMASMFSGAEAFNKDISNWDVSSTTILDFMFYNATNFNNGVPTDNRINPMLWSKVPNYRVGPAPTNFSTGSQLTLWVGPTGSGDGNSPFTTSG